jgi:hypothetical protein
MLQKVYSLLRKILAVISGMVFAIAILIILEIIGEWIWPPLGDADPTDHKNLLTATPRRPFGWLLVIYVAWIVGAFGGGWLASLIARRRFAAYVVCIWFILFILGEAKIAPPANHPPWVWVVVLLFMPFAAYLGAKLGTPRKLKAQ